MSVLYAVAFIAFFSAVNFFLWGDDGYNVHVLGTPVNAYMLGWFWIALISMIFGASCATQNGTKTLIGHVISGWWVCNIAMTTLLNSINHRPIEQAGDLFFGIPGIVLDFVAQGAVDLAAIFVLWLLVKKGTLRASAWLLVFCGYLVANLFGHASGAYGLMVGADPNTVAAQYEAFMYTIFTLMLVIQAAGASGNAVLYWIGSSVDLYADIRPYILRFIGRDLHLH